MRFLIIKPSSLGDIIHALPVASAMKRRFPDADIDWVAGKGFDEILVGNPFVARIIGFDRKMFKGGGGSSRLAEFTRELRRNRYDAVIDLQGLLRSGLMTAACRADVKLGFANAREGAPLFYTRKIAVPDLNVHAVDRYLLVLDALGVPVPETPEFIIYSGSDEAAQVRSILETAGIAPGDKFIAIGPGARWKTKRWPAVRFIEFARLLLEKRGIKSVFIGAKDDAELFAGGPSLGYDGMAFGKTSLLGLAELLRQASLFVTNDSGPMHIAAAVGTQVLAIFGPTDPRRTGPYGSIHKVITSGEGCAPCFKRDCSNTACMDNISVDRLIEEVETIL